MTDVFTIRDQLIDEYRTFTSGFVDMRDPRVREHVERELNPSVQWSDPCLSLCCREGGP
jgi:hypothetical protein